MGDNIVPANLKFKHKERLSMEWANVFRPLQERLLALANFCEQELGKKSITITCLSRTASENASVRGNPDSMHLTSPIRAADMRFWGYKQRELELIKAWWTSAGKGWDCVIEKDHIHLECDRRVKA